MNGVRLQGGRYVAVAVATAALGLIGSVALAQAVVPIPIISNVVGIAP